MPLCSDRNGYIIFVSFENQKFERHGLDGSSNLRDIFLYHASVVRCNMVSEIPLNYFYQISLLTGILGVCICLPRSILKDTCTWMSNIYFLLD